MNNRSDGNEVCGDIDKDIPTTSGVLHAVSAKNKDSVSYSGCLKYRGKMKNTNALKNTCAENDSKETTTKDVHHENISNDGENLKITDLAEKEYTKKRDEVQNTDDTKTDDLKTMDRLKVETMIISNVKTNETNKGDGTAINDDVSRNTYKRSPEDIADKPYKDKDQLNTAKDILNFLSNGASACTSKDNGFDGESSSWKYGTKVVSASKVHFSDKADIPSVAKQHASDKGDVTTLKCTIVSHPRTESCGIEGTESLYKNPGKMSVIKITPNRISQGKQTSIPRIVIPSREMGLLNSRAMYFRPMQVPSETSAILGVTSITENAKVLEQQTQPSTASGAFCWRPYMTYSKIPASTCSQNINHVSDSISDNISHATSVVTSATSGQRETIKKENGGCISDERLAANTALPREPRKFVAVKVGSLHQQHQQMSQIHSSMTSQPYLVHDEIEAANLHQMENSRQEPLTETKCNPFMQPSGSSLNLRQAMNTTTSKLKASSVSKWKYPTDMYPAIPNAYDIQRHLQETISMTAFQPLAGGSHAKTSNNSTKLTSHDHSCFPENLVKSESHVVQDETTCDKGTFQMSEEVAAALGRCYSHRKKIENDAYINNVYVKYATTMLMDRWEEYLTLGFDDLCRSECDRLSRCYGKEAIDMLEDRDRYVWQLIDELGPTKFVF